LARVKGERVGVVVRVPNDHPHRFIFADVGFMGILHNS
jgi:hypothetical protein